MAGGEPARSALGAPPWSGGDRGWLKRPSGERRAFIFRHALRRGAWRKGLNVVALAASATDSPISFHACFHGVFRESRFGEGAGAWPLRTGAGKTPCSSRGAHAVRRSLLTLLIVAGISGLLSQGERAAGVSGSGEQWVRTSAGWEPRRYLEARGPAVPSALHPAVVAAFQLGASLFFLTAFPTGVAALRPRGQAAPASARRRPEYGQIAAAG